jgi:hypothetical protein
LRASPSKNVGADTYPFTRREKDAAANFRIAAQVSIRVRKFPALHSGFLKSVISSR